MEQKLDHERQAELDLFKSKLSQIQQKFLNEWTGEPLKNLIKLRDQQALENVERRQGIRKVFTNVIEIDNVKCYHVSVLNNFFSWNLENVKGFENKIAQDRGKVDQLVKGVISK